MLIVKMNDNELLCELFDATLATVDSAIFDHYICEPLFENDYQYDLDQFRREMAQSELNVAD